MTINEVMLRYNFISKVQFKDGDSSLDKDLKIKVMDMRIEFGKIKKQLEADLKEFVDGLASEEMKQLSVKADKTAEEEKQLEDYNKQINDDYNTYLKKRGIEDVTVKETQKVVNGIAKVKLYKGHAQVVARQSANSLYDENLATYTSADSFDQDAAIGFIKLWGLPTQVNSQVNHPFDK